MSITWGEELRDYHVIFGGGSSMSMLSQVTPEELESAYSDFDRYAHSEAFNRRVFDAMREYNEITHDSRLGVSVVKLMAGERVKERLEDMSNNELERIKSKLEEALERLGESNSPRKHEYKEAIEALIGMINMVIIYRGLLHL